MTDLVLDLMYDIMNVNAQRYPPMITYAIRVVAVDW